MVTYRITKYNPKFRNSSGAYTRDEWTSVCDVGKSVSLDDYLKAETAYTKAALCLYKHFGIDEVIIQELEKHHYQLPEGNTSITNTNKMRDVYKNARDGTIINIEESIDLIRLILRENVWCTLHCIKEGLTIRFGYDYYMYVELEGGFLPQELIEEIQSMGLFVETR